MKTRSAIFLVACVVLVAVGCSRDSASDKVATAPAATSIATPVDDTVAAVLQSQDKPELLLRYKWRSAPTIGETTTLELDVSATTVGGAYALEASGSNLDMGDHSSVNLVVPDPGKSVRHTLAVTPKEVGWTELVVRLKSASPDVAEIRYSVPVLIVARADAQNGKASDKSDPAAKANDAKPQSN
jgi:hypothetical protein